MPKFLDFLGTTANALIIGIGGVRIKNSTGNLLVRNTGDTADAAITALQLNNSGDQIILNSDAANSGADYALGIRRPITGMTASYNYTLPTTPGTAGQVQATDGSGNTYWMTVANTATCITTDTTPLAFGSASPVAMFTLPANAVIQAVRVFVDTAFNGSPSMSVGIAGSTSKYLSSSQVDLKDTALAKIYEVYPASPPSGTTEALIISYSAGGATAGVARVEVDYVVPI